VEQVYFLETGKSALHDRGASAGDEGDYEGSAWPFAIPFSMATAHYSCLLITLVSF